MGLGVSLQGERPRKRLSQLPWVSKTQKSVLEERLGEIC